MCVVQSGFSTNPALNSLSASEGLENSAPKSVDVTKTKCTIVLREDIEIGSLLNVSAVLAVSLGRLHPEMVGEDLLDASCYVHQGITTMAIPVLKATGAQLKTMRSSLKLFEPGLTVIDVISATRSTRSYEEYAKVLETDSEEKIEYWGVAIFGDKKAVLKFTGGLPLFR